MSESCFGQFSLSRIVPRRTGTRAACRLLVNFFAGFIFFAKLKTSPHPSTQFTRKGSLLISLASEVLKKRERQPKDTQLLSRECSCMGNLCHCVNKVASFRAQEEAGIEGGRT
ncbi:hypothetical protein TWF506_011498 [Arthrobotrys conoides]|uniref:Uncharacterized protein n=1 Tax=Arthrobotrys conoides TaxID=74498 RepID=A0AAN8NFY6_9PEZI